MAPIKGIKAERHYLQLVLHFALLMLLLVPVKVKAQEQPETGRQKVVVHHADLLMYDKIDGRERKKLLGNVFLQHKDMLMNCDSAWYYEDTNQVFAFSNIHIHQGDTIHIYGRYLSYDGNTSKAVMTDSVEMVDKETRLFTDKINYDTRSQIADYNTGGRLLNGENTLTSRIGIYYAAQKMAHFRDSVKIVNPKYVMKADTLRYNTLTEVAYFEGPSEAKGDSIYLYCEKGWSNTKSNVSRLMKNAVLDNMKQRLSGDTLFYDETKGYGEGFGNVLITDEAGDATASGNYGWYFKEPERFMMTRDAAFTFVSKDDTLTLRADTLRAVPQADSSGINHRLLKAYNNCTIFSTELQGVCDSLSFSFRDSVVRLYTEPVIWSDENQMTADSMALFTVNHAPQRMELYNTPFIVSSVDSARFNQVKGKSLVGYFKDNKLSHVVIDGNGELIFYVVDGTKLIGVNKAKCATIEIFLKEGKVQYISQNMGPDGTMDPPSPGTSEEPRLDNFRWFPEKRPARADNQKYLKFTKPIKSIKSE
jgi:lipopolysaccharide export system protein LptA